MVKLIVGAQWGDEGKGRVVDVGKPAKLYVRYSGGNNAGHTIVLGHTTLKLHLLPSGVLHPSAMLALGGGLVVDPRALCAELDEVSAIVGVERFNGLFKISPRATVITPYEIVLDKLLEDLRAEHTGRALGTTGRGIGPAYAMKSLRIALRMGDLLEASLVKERVGFLDAVVRRMDPQLSLSLDAVCEDLVACGERLRPYIHNVDRLVRDAVQNGQDVVFEGAQGAMLDLDYGTYPYVTSSNTGLAGLLASVAISPASITERIGVVKAYTTRVGDGPFPTELLDALGTGLRERGVEYGATTGRPRRCGWLDLVPVRRAIQVNGLTGLVITKLDVLTGMDVIRVGVRYGADGKVWNELPDYVRNWEHIVPEYEDFIGWHAPITKDNFRGSRAEEYVQYVERMLGIPVVGVSIGAERNAYIPLHAAG